MLPFKNLMIETIFLRTEEIFPPSSDFLHGNAQREHKLKGDGKSWERTVKLLAAPLSSKLYLLMNF